jgi:hypothetical protein
MGTGKPVVEQQPVPDDALLRTYRGGNRPELWGRYGDCFTIEVDRAVTLTQWVFAFYTSPLFRIERFILRVLAKAPSNDQQAEDVATGRRETFAIWVVGARTEDQLLMCDRYGKTRTWFRIVPQAWGGTMLQFGSAVAARPGPGATGMSGGFKLLLEAHKMYSRLLIGAGRKRAMARTAPTCPRSP